MQKLSGAPSARQRLIFVDWARGLAIALALFSHVMLGAGGWDSLRETAPALYGLRVLTRMATPTFILLFGLSLEMAYTNKWSGNSGPTIRRIMRRAVQCYLALVAVGVAALIGGLASPLEAAESLAFLTPVINGDIFLFYVFALLLTPLLIMIRIKIGLTWTLIITLAWWPISYMIDASVEVPATLDFLLSRSLGIGEGAGPSALHSLPLVVLGMIIAVSLRPESGTDRRRGIYAMSALVAGVFLVIAIDGPIDAIQSYVQDYRANNHPGYYLLGGMFAVSILLACWLIETRTRLLNRDKRGAFGTDSLIAFALGNVLINLTLRFVQSESLPINLAVAIGFVGTYWLAFTIWHRHRGFVIPCRGGRRASRIHHDSAQKALRSECKDH